MLSFCQDKLLNFFRTTLLFSVLLELLSIFAWALPQFNLICFIVILLITFILSLKKLRYGIYIAAAELIIGSQGYLFSLNLNHGAILISLRIGLFATVMFAWVIYVLRHGGFAEYWQQLKSFKFFKYYLALAIVIIWGVIWGVIRNNFGNVFFDSNNWLFFIYLLPLISVHRSEKFWYELKPILLAALTWLIIKTLLLLYIFSHQFVWALPEVYRWVRDTRVGEITYFSDNFYRIFIQSQIYALLGFFILLPIFNKVKNSELNHSKLIQNLKFRIQNFFTPYYLLFTACLATIIISFSRSFWAGLIFGLLIFIILQVTSYLPADTARPALPLGKLQVIKYFRPLLTLILSVVISIAIIFLIINLPPKISGDSLGSLISQRTSQIEAAGSSRLNMLKPLGRAIVEHPVIGSGFGATVTYRSVDPRILSTTAGASGEYTTYAFEWNYLDMLLKVGLAGLAIYLLLIFKIFQALWQQINFEFRILNFESTSNSSIQNSKLNINSKFKIQNSKFATGLFLSLLSLLAVNFFTPYLNHPLGISFILIISIFVDNNSKLNHSKLNQN